MINLAGRLVRLTILFSATVILASTSAAPLVAQVLTLADAIDSALSSHPDLRGESARTVRAEEVATAARATRWPSVGVDLSLMQFQDPMLAQPIHSFDPNGLPRFNETLLQGTVGLQYTLLGGGRSSRIEGSQAGLEAARAQREAVEQRLIETVAEAYLAVLAGGALHTAAIARVTALVEEEARAGRRFDAGTAPAVEILRATAALQDARAQETEAANGVALAERGLGRLIGTEVGAVARASIADVTFAGQPAVSDSHTNPRVVQAQRLADATQAKVSEQRAALYPRLDVTAGVVDYALPTGPHVVEWQAGVRLSWSVFSGGSWRAAVRGAEAEVMAAQSDLESLRLRVDQEADAARTALETASARAEAFAVSVVQWEELARIEALALDLGTGVQSDLLRAEAALFQAQAGHVRARYQAILAHVRLAAAQGILSRAWVHEALETSP